MYLKQLKINRLFLEIEINKENNVFKDALGVKGLGFKHHGNHPQGRKKRCSTAAPLRGRWPPPERKVAPTLRKE